MRKFLGKTFVVTLLAVVAAETSYIVKEKKLKGLTDETIKILEDSYNSVAKALKATEEKLLSFTKAEKENKVKENNEENAEVKSSTEKVFNDGTVKPANFFGFEKEDEDEDNYPFLKDSSGEADNL